MAGFLSDVQPAVKKETKNVLIYTAVGTALMWAVFFGLHLVLPEKVPFGYEVILAGVLGCAVAVLNFFLMGLTVQRIAGMEDQEQARRRMQVSFSRRKLMQGAWVVVAVVAPCFNPVAGLVPLFFPGTGIKIAGILDYHKRM